MWIHNSPYITDPALARCGVGRPIKLFFRYAHSLLCVFGALRYDRASFRQHLALAVANQFDRPPENYPSGGEVAEWPKATVC